MATSGLAEDIATKPTTLSEDQKKAVLSESRYNRIIAGAGAGKTETLTRRIAYLILVQHVKPTSIVAFTFTEKAAQSMKSRIYQRVEQISGSDAAANLGEMYIGTIHGYAKRILEDYFRFGNHFVLDENQEVAFLMRHGWSLGIKKYANNYGKACQIFLRAINMVWGEMLDEVKLKKRAPDFYEELKRYENILKEHKQLTFGRMIHEAVLNLRSAQDTLAHVHHLIVDEYQDINQAQAELISLVGKNAGIFVVGDPRQSIYQWRGSDEKFFDVFSEMFPGTETTTIRENRRSVKKIVLNANKFAESFQRIHYEKMEPTRGEEGFIGLASHKTPQDEAKWIANQIEQLTKTNNLKFSDIGILTRSVSTSAGTLIDELKTRRIPYIVGGKVGLFKRDEARALGMIFAWFSKKCFWNENPYDPSETITGDALLESALVCWNSSHDHGYPEDAEDNLRRLKENLDSDVSSYRNFTKLYQDVLTILGFQRLNYEDANDAAVMANLGRFNNLLTDYESVNRIGGRSTHWVADLNGLCWFMNTYAIQAYEEQPSDDIRAIDAVQVMTIHQAKGLEWPIVFLFATVKGRFPPSRLGSESSWCGIPREMFNAERYGGDIEDERRLFYVAITRAKDALVCSYFKQIARNFSPSMFIQDLDPNLMTALDDDDALPRLNVYPSKASDEIQTFSAEEIITYGVCPHMYLLRDIWGYQPQLNQAIGFGNSLHYCLRRAGELIKNDGYSPISAAATAVDEGFYLPFVGGQVFTNFKKSAGKILSNFSTKYGNDLKRIEEVEYRLEFPIQNATIMGKVDVILRDEGTLEVREYKTSRKVRTFEEVSVQVRLYALGLKSLGKPVAGGSVAFLQEVKVQPVEVTSSLLGKAKQDAEKTVESISKRQFKPNSGESCGRCDQKPICRWSRN